MTLSLIVAVAENGVIGNQGGLPWRLSSDLRRFRRLTMGHHIIMGRKTFETIGRPLPGRTMIVVTRQAHYDPGESVVASSLDQALSLAQGDSEPFVIGGADIFRSALPLTDRIYQTIVHDHPQGDAFFPEWNASQWRTIEEEFRPADEKNSAATTFRVLERTNSNHV